MKKIFALFLVFTLLISGCSLFKKNPQKAVNEAVQNFAEVKKMNSQLDLSGTVQSPEGEKPSKVQFALKASGKVDSADEQTPKIDIKFSVNASADGNGGSAEVLLKMLDKKIFVNLVNLSIPGEGGEALKTQFASLINKWWALPTTPESTVGKLTEEQKQLNEKLKTANFFTNAVEDAQEEIQGVKTTRYRVELDKEFVKQFILDMARITDNQLTPEEELAIGDSLKEIEFSGVIWVGNDDDILHKVRGTITVQPKQGPSSLFEIDYTGWDYGKDVAVAAPESSAEFNPLMILPVLGALGQISPSVPAQ